VTYSGHSIDRLGRVIPRGEWPPERQAPDQLELVRRFVNTYVVENDADVLSSVGELRAWTELELPNVSTTRFRASELVSARCLRDALRTSIITGDLSGLRPWTSQTSFRIQFNTHNPAMAATGRGFDELTGTLLLAVFTAGTSGTLSRLIACEHCHWIVFDHSRRGNVRWCSEAACGSRERARQYRQRSRSIRVDR
jgi:predicted RNA-binding Zn ribbon-like protein